MLEVAHGMSGASSSRRGAMKTSSPGSKSHQSRRDLGIWGRAYGPRVLEFPSRSIGEAEGATHQITSSRHRPSSSSMSTAKSKGTTLHPMGFPHSKHPIPVSSRASPSSMGTQPIPTWIPSPVLPVAPTESKLECLGLGFTHMDPHHGPESSRIRIQPHPNTSRPILWSDPAVFPMAKAFGSVFPWEGGTEGGIPSAESWIHQCKSRKWRTSWKLHLDEVPAFGQPNFHCNYVQDKLWNSMDNGKSESSKAGEFCSHEQFLAPNSQIIPLGKLNHRQGDGTRKGNRV